MNITIQSNFSCNSEGQFVDKKLAYLLRVIISNLAKSDLKRKSVQDYLASIIKETGTVIPSNFDIQDYCFEMMEEHLGTKHTKTIKLGKYNYALELEKNDIRELVETFTSDSSKWTIIKHYLISLFLSNSMYVPHLFELRKIVEKFEIPLNEVSVLATKVKDLELESSQDLQTDNEFHSKATEAIKKFNKAERESFFILLSNLAKCDYVIVKEELIFLKELIDILDIDLKEKFIPSDEDNKPSLESFSKESHLNLLKHFFLIAEVDGVVVPVEKLFLIHLVL